MACSTCCKLTAPRAFSESRDRLVEWNVDLQCEGSGYIASPTVKSCIRLATVADDPGPGAESERNQPRRVPANQS